ncbi:MAG: hypothetical protein AAYR33_04240 [Acetobacteraceae bacterium]
MRYTRFKRIANMIGFASLAIGMTRCDDPKPPPQAAQITPEEMSRKINAVETVQEQNEVASYQYYMQQQSQRERAGDKAGR